jgi:hypothetical protein
MNARFEIFTVVALKIQVLGCDATSLAIYFIFSIKQSDKNKHLDPEDELYINYQLDALTIIYS